MNIIADRLFALLLGWTGSLFNGLWNLITNESAGISGFLQRFWLPMILVLLFVGTAMDYIVWLIRWRPYFAWRAWFAQRANHRMMHATQHYMEDLDHLPLDLPEYQQEAGQQPDQAYYPQDEPVYFDFTPQPVLDWNGQEQPAPEIPDDFQEEAFIPVLPWDSPDQQLLPETQMPKQEAGMLPEQGLQLPTGAMEHRFEPALPVEASLPWLNEEPAPKAEGSPAPVRRRRSESRKNRSQSLIRTFRETILNPQEEVQGQTLMPPPITQEEAYHQPYYPQNYTFRAPQQPVPQQPHQQDKAPQGDPWG